ncbi:MAG: sigma-54 dependent transcriptional regulator, partial [Desulfobacterales bacterium]|jgi:DNA-binding NtrC family response regulator
MRKPTILIFGLVDILRQNLKKRLAKYGLIVNEAPKRCSINDLYNSMQPDLVIVCSTGKAPGDKLGIIRKIRQIDRIIPMILITWFSSESRAIAALRAGANDYFKLPLSSEKVVQRILQMLAISEFDVSSEGKSNMFGLLDRQLMIGESECIREIKKYLAKVARADSNVLITGETGTGKELTAGLIHSKSPRHKNPFVCINSAAIPETLVESELFGYDRGAFTGAVAEKPGKLELARKGTVFLDEIGDMNHYAQAKILRSIESREFFHLGGSKPVSFNARVIAATNKDPIRLIEERKMREDLYYRLNVARIHLPPLRKRKDDIPALISYAVDRLNHRFGRDVRGLTDEAVENLLRHDWPGNIRELFNLLESVYVNMPSQRRDFINLPERVKKQIKVTKFYASDERKRIVSTLLETNWNKSTAAQKLNWSRMTLYRKISKYNIVEKRAVQK